MGAGIEIGRGRLAVVVATVALVATCVLYVPRGAIAAGDANRSTCSADTLASPGYRSYLPDCRAYELATAANKNGAVILNSAAGPPISEDGDHVITGAAGAFAGAGNDWLQATRNPDIDAYMLTRGESGWVTTPITAPSSVFPDSALLAVSASSSLSPTLWDAEPNMLRYNEDVYMRTQSGEFQLVGPGIGPQVRGEGLLLPNEDLYFVGASANLTDSFFEVQAFSLGSKAEHHEHTNLWPGDTTVPRARSLYEYDYAGTPAAEPKLVGVRNHGVLTSNSEAELISSCGTGLGSSGTFNNEESVSMHNAVSETGSVVYFTAAQCPGGPPVAEVYARVAGSETVPISEPSRAACEICDTSEATELAPPSPGATFEGASKDGRKAFFLTEQALMPGQVGENIYEYDLQGPDASPQHPMGKVTDITAGIIDPEVQGVVRVSDDGSRIYFVAKGVLAGTNRELTAPQAGADNLYVYDASTRSTVFVARLLTESEQTSIETAESIEVASVFSLILERLATAEAELQHKQERGEITAEEAAERLQVAVEVEEEEITAATGTSPGTDGPSGTLREDQQVWATPDDRPVQATPSGRYLVFPTSAHVTGDGGSTLTPELFEYDAIAEKLVKVAGGLEGAVDSFHDSPKLAVQDLALADFPTAEEQNRAISEDGERVFFVSSAALADPAVNETTNVYEFSGGTLYLISDGHDASKFQALPTVSMAGIDPSGADVLFTTADDLVPGDTEEQIKIYDAREGGGFPAPTLAAGCFGETCRGAAGSPSSMVGVMSNSQPGEVTSAKTTVTVPRIVKHVANPSAAARAQRRAAAKCERLPKRSRRRCLKVLRAHRVKDARAHNHGKVRTR